MVGRLRNGEKRLDGMRRRRLSLIVCVRLLCFVRVALLGGFGRAGQQAEQHGAGRGREGRGFRRGEVTEAFDFVGAAGAVVGSGHCRRLLNQKT
jgi:hypothetical protein